MARPRPHRATTSCASWSTSWAAPTMGDYVPLLEEELALRGDDRRGPQWRKADVAPDRDFRVVVIGAGMSGIAHRLPARAGRRRLRGDREERRRRRHLVREHVSRAAGSTTPTTTTATPSRSATTGRCTTRTRKCCTTTSATARDEFGVLDHIRFGTEVRSATWDDATATWSVVVRNPDGTDETLVANAVVSAVGQLNRPHFPEHPRHRHASRARRSTPREWDHDAPI